MKILVNIIAILFGAIMVPAVVTWRVSREFYNSGCMVQQRHADKATYRHRVTMAATLLSVVTVAAGTYGWMRALLVRSCLSLDGEVQLYTLAFWTLMASFVGGGYRRLFDKLYDWSQVEALRASRRQMAKCRRRMHDAEGVTQIPCHCTVSTCPLASAYDVRSEVSLRDVRQVTATVQVAADNSIEVAVPATRKVYKPEISEFNSEAEGMYIDQLLRFAAAAAQEKSKK